MTDELATVSPRRIHRPAAMKVLTVQQPWAWAIVHGGKDVENRTQAWSYRGPLAIHAGKRWSERGGDHPLVQAAIADASFYDDDPSAFEARGAIIGVVDLVAVHPADLCEQLGAGDLCSPWAEASYREHSGRSRNDVVHLELANPRPLAVPIPCPGRLGLWTPTADVFEQLSAVA